MKKTMAYMLSAVLLLGNLIAKYANVLEITEPPDTGQVIPFAPKKSTHDIPIENDKAA